MAAPVTKSEAALARKTAMPAMSSIVPQRWAGVRRSTFSLRPGTSRLAAAVRSVSIQPGSTALTWMLSAAHAVAGRAHEPRARGLVGHVDAPRERGRAEPFDPRDRAPGLVGVARRHHDAGARRGETTRHPEPDPTVATGHDGHPPLEVEHAGLPFAVRITSAV